MQLNLWKLCKQSPYWTFISAPLFAPSARYHSFYNFNFTAKVGAPIQVHAFRQQQRWSKNVVVHVQKLHNQVKVGLWVLHRATVLLDLTFSLCRLSSSSHSSHFLAYYTYRYFYYCALLSADRTTVYRKFCYVGHMKASEFFWLVPSVKCVLQIELLNAYTLILNIQSSVTFESMVT